MSYTYITNTQFFNPEPFNQQLMTDMRLKQGLDQQIISNLSSSNVLRYPINTTPQPQYNALPPPNNSYCLRYVKAP